MDGKRNQEQDGRRQRRGPPRGESQETPDLDHAESDRRQAFEQELQRPDDARTNANPPANQPAQEEPRSVSPASEDLAVEEYAGENPLGEQSGNNNHDNSSAPDAARMSISERLERNLITDIKGLTRQEEDELLYWAKEIKKMKWKDIRSRFKFKLEENTLRGRLWHYQIKKDLKKPPPRKAIFTERDIELLLEAIETLNGGHLDDVEKSKTRALWTGAKKYIKEHGGKTTAGPSTLKTKYKELTQEVAEIRKDLKPGKANWDHDNYKAYKVPGQEEASFEEDAEEEELGGKSGTNNGGATDNARTIDWVHSEYEKYDVEWEEGADFGGMDVDRDDKDEEDEDEEDEDSEDPEA